MDQSILLTAKMFGDFVAVSITNHLGFRVIVGKTRLDDPKISVSDNIGFQYVLFETKKKRVCVTVSTEEGEKLNEWLCHNAGECSYSAW